MVNVNEIERKLKAKDLGENGIEGVFVRIVGAPKLDIDEESGVPSGKIVVPVRYMGRRFNFYANIESIDAISKVLGLETSEWVQGEVFVQTKSAKMGQDNISWVIATNAQQTPEHAQLQVEREKEQKMEEARLARWSEAAKRPL